MKSASVNGYGIESAGTEEQELEILYGLAHDLARSSDSAAIADHLFARATHLLEADTAFLMRIDAGYRVLRGIAAFGMDAETFRQERIELNANGTSLRQKCRREREIDESGAPCQDREATTTHDPKAQGDPPWPIIHQAA